MKLKNVKWLWLIVVLLIMAMVVTACGGDDADDDVGDEDMTEEESEEVSEEEEEEAEAFTLKFLTLNDEEHLLALDTMVKDWKAANPMYANVTVEIESVPFSQLFPKIEASVAAGADFDAFLADGPDMKHYAYNGAVIPLEPYYTAEEIAEFVPQSIEEGSYKGTFYGPAIMQSCSMMFFNKDFTDEAGLNPPEAVKGYTMAEAWDAWEKTTVDSSGDGTPDVWGLRWGQGTWTGDYEQGIPRRSAGVRGSNTFAGMGADAITFVGYMDTPEAIMAFETYRGWHIGDRAVTPVEAIPDIFENKLAAFMISPDNRIGSINRLYPDGDFNYGVTGIPYFEDGAQLCHTGSWHFGVTPGSDYQDAAASMVKYFASHDGALTWFNQTKQLPARFDLINTLPEYTGNPQKMFSDGLIEIGEPRIQTPCYTEYQQFTAELLQNLGQGTDVDVEDLVKTTTANIEQACTKYAGWDQ